MSRDTAESRAFGFIWRGLQRAGRSWFHLTHQERLALLVVLGIFLLGVVTRWWLR